jgi:hypothetical protein
MKVTLAKQVKYFGVDALFKLKLGHLFRLFQEAAIEHSEKVGLGFKTLATRALADFPGIGRLIVEFKKELGQDV